MTPEITTRSFTNDQTVFNKVFFDNIYKIKGEKDSSKVFVDIGAHAGYFTFTALSLGARKVYSFEPFVDSYKLLLENCYNYYFVGRITPYQLGVYTEKKLAKFTIPELIDNIYFDMNSIGISIDPDNEENFYPCQCATLDEILKTYCFDEKIDILKINIGYAEKEILLLSSLIEKNVESICAEITIEDEELFDFKKAMGTKGFVNFFSSESKEGRKLMWLSKIDLSKNFNI
jgi:FkbM family methyltransferase